MIKNQKWKRHWSHFLIWNAQFAVNLFRLDKWWVLNAFLEITKRLMHRVHNFQPDYCEMGICSLLPPPHEYGNNFNALLTLPNHPSYSFFPICTQRQSQKIIFPVLDNLYWRVSDYWKVPYRWPVWINLLKICDLI